MDEYYSTSDLPCKKHPSSSSVGICAYCLKDRLIKLVCSDCGEQRLSSCSCSEISSNRNSCTVDVGSVGRVSFLIENDNSSKPKIHTPKTENDTTHNLTHHDLENDDNGALFLRRSNSSCVDIKRRNGFWRFGKFFRKKKEKDHHPEKAEMWVVDHVAVSRSRSLCSFRGGGGGGGASAAGGWFGSDDGARSSISGARSSSVTACMVLDSGRRSGFSEAEPRKSGFDGGGGGYYYSDVDQFGTNRRVFSLKESDYFNGMDESGFIDLKLDYSAESNSNYSNSNLNSNSKPLPSEQFVTNSSESAFGSMRTSSTNECYYGGNGYGESGENGVFSRGGSCRITVNDRGLKKGRKSMKGWRWIFKHHLGSGIKKDEDLMFKT